MHLTVQMDAVGAGKAVLGDVDAPFIGKVCFNKGRQALYMVKASNAYGDVAKNVKMPPEMESQMARTSLRSILKQVAKSITPADVQQLNAALNKIKKES